MSKAEVLVIKDRNPRERKQMQIGTKVRVVSGEWQGKTGVVIRPTSNTAREYKRVKLDENGKRVRILATSLVEVED